MVEVTRHGILLKPTMNSFENKGVFNPAVVKKGKDIHMYYRAWDKNNTSTVGYARLDSPLNVVERWDKPFMVGTTKYEKSVEDPRVTLINGVYYMPYVAYDGKAVRIAYATSKDLKKFKKQGIISPNISYDETEDIFRNCKSKLKERYFLFESYFKDIVGKDVLLWDKDVFFFPKKIKGKFAMVHRILPDMQIIYFNDFKDLTLKYWKDYYKRMSDYVILESKYWFESRNIGGGCPPIETDKGWLLIYHAVDDMNKGKVYRVGAVLLDKNDPTKEIGRLREPLLSPEEEWEHTGNVGNVVFPTGCIEVEGKYYIYYGAADEVVSVFSVDKNELLKELTR